MGEGGFETIDFGHTWKDRNIGHAFLNRPEAIKNHGTVDIHYSDHKLIFIEIMANASRKSHETIISRDLRKLRANPQYFEHLLRGIDWAEMIKMIDDVDEMVHFYTTSVIKCLDEAAEMKEKKLKPRKFSLPKELEIEKKERDTLYNSLERAKENMREHMKNHKKPFSCGVCDKKFGCVEHFKTHERTHKDKPFSCFQYKQELSKIEALKDHLATHRVEPFSCNLCDQNFASNKHLRIHKSTHTDAIKGNERNNDEEQPFSCPY